VDAATKPVSAEQPTPDLIREVLSKLVASLDQLPSSAKNLGTKIQELDTAARDPVRFNQKSVQHEICYAAQDFEKATGKPLDLSANQRAEVENLAGSAPGLVNERMIELLRRTAQIDSSSYVDQIRRSAAEIGQQRDQNKPGIKDQIEQLENKVRLAPRVPETDTDARAEGTTTKTDQRTSGVSGKAVPNGSVHEAQRPENGFDRRGGHNGSAADHSSVVQNAVLRGGVLDTLASAIRGNGQANAPPWEPQATPFGDRLRDFQDKVARRDQDSAIGRVEKSARATMDALDGFRNTEGATVMNRVQTAARADPGGMAGVLSEMREGGRFNNLRQAFNKALTDDKGFADAYDRAAGALARYGQGREQVEQIFARWPDSANLTAKFEQLDSQIGERATCIPSRNDGKNMLDDIGKNIAEIIQRATDAVRAAFSRTPSAGPSASPAA
jgi:hypothetical protein